MAKRIITLMLLLSFVSFAHSEVVKMNYDWFVKNDAYVIKTIQTQESKAVIPIMNTLGNMWKKRDASIGKEISYAIANISIYHQKIFFTWFSDNKEDFMIWVNSIQDILFTDYSGVRFKQLEEIKMKMITSISNYEKIESNKKIKNLAHILLQKLKTIEVRKIE